MSTFKKLFSLFSLLFALTALASGCATAGAESQPQEQALDAVAEQPADQPNKAAIGVRTDRHVQVALLTARQMFDGVGGYQADQVTIVVCGPGVKSLLADTDIEAEIERTQKEGDVRVIACGLTLEAMELDASALAPSVEVVPNGFIELARLQAAGYEAVVL